MTSLAAIRREKEAENATHWPEEKLRPWTFKQKQENEYLAMVDDLEKLLALGSCMKENYGSSEIDRALGVLAEDMLAQENQDFVVLEDNEVTDLLQQIKEEEAAARSTKDVEEETFRKLDNKPPASNDPLPPLASGRKPTSSRPPHSARSSCSSSLSPQQRGTSPRVSSAKYMSLYQPRLSAAAVIDSSAASNGRHPLPPKSARQQPASARRRPSSAPSSDRTIVFTTTPTTNNKPAAAGATTGTSPLPSARQGKITLTPRASPRILLTPRPSTAVAGTAAAGVVAGLETTLPLPQNSARLQPSPRCSANNNSNNTWATGLGSLGDENNNKISKAHQEQAAKSTLILSSKMHQQQGLLAGELYKMPADPFSDMRADTPRIYGPNSKQNSQAYALDLGLVAKNGVQSKSVVNNYKKRQGLLKKALSKFEWELISKLDPSQLRNHMKKLGKIDHVWEIFNDPTIKKEDQKKLMTTQFQNDFALTKYMEDEIRRGPLFPEYQMSRSEAAKWAEIALACGYKVFQSGGVMKR